MRGMSALMALRLQRIKPDAVFVYLVERKDDQQPIMSDKRNLVIEIERSDSLSEIDFRPLIGMKVHMCNVGEDAQRYRQLGALMAKAKPARLVMPIETESGMVVHQLEDGKTGTF